MITSESRSAIVAAIATGTYLAIFYIMGNLTMLPAMSMVFIWVVLTLPMTIGVVVLAVLLRAIGRQNYLGFATAFFAALYMLIILREPVFEAQSVADFRNQFEGISWYIVHLILFLVPAVALAYVFRRDLDKYSAILAVMSVAAIALGLLTPAVSDTKWRETFLENSDNYLPSITLAYKPNIYLILADGFGSFEFMERNNVDVSSFRANLAGMGFRAYEDFFSNYHATTSAMLAMLDMEHHYYMSTFKGAEVGKTAREIIGGRNNILRLLKGNGYSGEYIHQGNYLLLQGCTADYCYPDPSSIAASQNVLREILPYAITSRFAATDTEWQKEPTDLIRKMVIDRVSSATDSPDPVFRYVHIFDPGHAPNALIDTCDEGEELRKYSAKVSSASQYLSELIEDIISHDPDAVIVLTGDHGPFISQRCNPYIDLDEPAEYRDRVGALLAIRWPEIYHGEYDAQIKTSINVFRYVLASLAEDDTEILNTLVAEDVFVLGNNRVLQILLDGEIVVPPLTLGDEK